MTARTAQCACGRLQVTVQDEPVGIWACHCDFCQKRTGSVFPVSAYFLKDQPGFDVSGEAKIFNGLEIDGVGNALGEGVSFHFCPTCGSTVYFVMDDRPMLAVPVGCFVDPEFPAPTMQGYVNMRHHWLPAIADAVQFEGMPPDA